MTTALVWFRRDLRLSDNPALHEAATRHARVLPAFIWSPDEEAPWAPGAASRWWLHHSLRALSAALEAAGAPLVIAAGPTLDTLRGLARTSGACAVYWNRLYEPALVARDRAVKEALRADGLEAESFNGALLVEPWEIKTGDGGPYRVFTPFWRAASARLDTLPAPLPAPSHLRAPAKRPPQLPPGALELLPKIPWDQGFRARWQPGEKGAHHRLDRFCDTAAAAYKDRRDEPGAEGTSRLSPALHFGEIGPRQIVWRLRRAVAESGEYEAGVAACIRELGWREFAHHLLFHFPQTPEQPLDEKFAAFPWREPRDYAADLHAWQRGRTGIPIVDAGLRELWSTGWMHNRVRMLVASLLTKNLLIPWQEGARWFWDTLVDANLANNTLGWQWTAGCGADAAPYFRIFNPTLQSTKFDGHGAYIRRWIPELGRLPDSALHAPERAGAAVLAAAGVRLGIDYPLPIVDLAVSRRQALQAYETQREAARLRPR
jgi:deoxyribodipyrimidine photo-lyase